MRKIRRASTRGHFNHGWLDTYHTFSFGSYHDPEQMGFRALRVLNDDTVAPGAGFGTHGHRDMEILSYVLDGALEHRDSMGTGSVLRPGDVQRMTAGTGVTHSEFNHSQEAPVHFLQIWVLPKASGLAPGYEERHFTEEERQGRLRLVASPKGEDASLSWNQDVFAYASLLRPSETVEHPLRDGRHAWLHVARGRVAAGEHELRTGDGLAVSEEPVVTLRAVEPSELLLFDLG